MAVLRVISDVHQCINNRDRFGDHPSYVEICSELSSKDYSVQLGDLGYDYSDMNKVDWANHKCINGNHDRYDELGNIPHFLGDYGMAKLRTWDFFFIRGAFSLDKKMRIKYEQSTGIRTWFKEEELTQEQGKLALDCYEKNKPDVVFSHECPSGVAHLLGNKDFLLAFGYSRDMVSSTQHLHQQLLEIHSPKMWIFGHWHKNWEVKYRGCHFRCIAERQFLDFDEQWNIVDGSEAERKSSGL